ncbi:MAG: hypothetical protein F6J98_01590 [Moorea sp. SIO4G2]|nr:hypothetical protein [Moorena sp. SIO4G2]
MVFDSSTDFSSLGFRKLPGRDWFNFQGKTGLMVWYDRKEGKEHPITDKEGNPLRCIFCQIEELFYHVGYFKKEPYLKLWVALKNEHFRGMGVTTISSTFARGFLLALFTIPQDRIKDPVILGIRENDPDAESLVGLCSLYDQYEERIEADWNPGLDIFKLANDCNKKLTGHAIKLPDAPESDLQYIWEKQGLKQQAAAKEYTQRQGQHAKVNRNVDEWIAGHELKDELLAINEEIKRIGYTGKECKELLLKYYDVFEGITSRQLMNNDQIIRLLAILKKLPPKEIQEGVF